MLTDAEIDKIARRLLQLIRQEQCEYMTSAEVCKALGWKMATLKKHSGEIKHGKVNGRNLYDRQAVMNLIK